MAETKKNKPKKTKMQRIKDLGKIGLGVTAYELGPEFIYGIGQGLGFYEKGGKVGKGPKGCGAALRGYGKAMKKKGK